LFVKSEKSLGRKGGKGVFLQERTYANFCWRVPRFKKAIGLVYGRSEIFHSALTATLLPSLKIDGRTFARIHVEVFFQHAHLYIRESECRFMVFLFSVFHEYAHLHIANCNAGSWRF
jgi:hypothetical protein